LALRDRSVFFRIPEEINLTLERHFWFVALVLVFLLLAAGIVQDVRKKMWIDELYTFYMSHQANPTEIVRATLEGCDGAPPLYAIMVHAILPWVPREELTVRLPATLGYCGMVLCLIAFCRPRLPAVYSLMAAALACYGALDYLTEGRGYGIVLCCAAGALLCWQAAMEGRRRVMAVPMLALCLAVMTAIHYYSVFFLAPLFVAEMVRWRRSGKLDIAVLMAMAAPLPVLALHYPLILAGERFEQHFWSPARLHNIPELYSPYLEIGLPIALLAAFSISRRSAKPAQPTLTIAEWVAAATFSLMPFCVLVLSRFTTHVFVDRYTLWAVPGVAVLATTLFYLAADGSIRVGVITLVFILGLIGFREVSDLSRRPALLEGEGIRQALSALQDDSEPIVIADHHVFMEISYYGSPEIRQRVIYPVNRDLDLRYFGFDTGALLMSALSHRTRLHIIGYDVMLATYPRFVLAALPKDYLPWQLTRAGYRVVPVDPSAVPTLYQVDSPASP